MSPTPRKVEKETLLQEIDEARANIESVIVDRQILEDYTGPRCRSRYCINISFNDISFST